MIIARSGGATQRELIPAGSHVARCYEMIHLGHVEENYMGEEKVIDKVRLTFEIPGEMRVFNEEKGEQPFVTSKEYTLSMHPKSNIRKDLENWRGQAFTEQESDDFDITKLLGVACMLSIVHVVAKNGNEYANIGNISGLPKGIDCLPQINPTLEFNYTDKFDLDYIESLPDFIKDKIKSSVEYKANIDKMMGEEEAKKQNAVMDKQADDAIANDASDLPF